MDLTLAPTRLSACALAAGLLSLAAEPAESASPGLTFERSESKVVMMHAVDERRVAGARTRATTGRPFLGLDDQPQTCPGHYLGCSPADPAIAVSPSWVLEAAESAVAVYDHSGRIAAGWPKRAESFFGIPLFCGKREPLPVAPHALYDSYDRRFFVAIDEFSGPARGCPVADRLWIAVSRTSDPNGTWNVYAFDHKHGGTAGIGMDARAVYFSENFAWGDYWTGIFGASKAAMESGAPLDAAHGFDRIAYGGTPLDTLFPATISGGGAERAPVEYFANSFTLLFGGGGCVLGCSGAAVWAMAAGDTARPSLSGVVVPTDEYVAPPLANQPGCTRCMDSGSTAVSASPVYQGGLITFALETATSNGTQTVPGIYWLQLQPQLSGTTLMAAPIVQSGRVFYPDDQAASFSALGSDLNGDLALVFDTMSHALNPSVAYAVRRGDDPPGTFGPPQIIAAGQAPANEYNQTPFGDYSAVSSARAKSLNVWIVSSLTRSDGNWTTVMALVTR